ncbi:MAG: hypothetical protein LUQ59_08970 [Methanothrix sp.]|nr:hypothetical protein [Methanothrix sp.]
MKKLMRAHIEEQDGQYVLTDIKTGKLIGICAYIEMAEYVQRIVEQETKIPKPRRRCTVRESLEK